MPVNAEERRKRTHMHMQTVCALTDHCSKAPVLSTSSFLSFFPEHEGPTPAVSFTTSCSLSIADAKYEHLNLDFRKIKQGEESSTDSAF